MSSKFYEMRDDLYVPNRWFLGDLVDRHGNEIDGRVFTEGSPAPPKLPLWEGDAVELAPPLRFKVKRPGVALDWTFAPFDLPVVQGELADGIASIAPRDIELIPVQVEETPDDYMILNVTRRLRCLDEAKSVYGWWTEADGRPEMVGKYRGVNPTVLVADKVRGCDIFRVDGWEILLIVSGRVQALFESSAATGVKFGSVEQT